MKNNVPLSKVNSSRLQPEQEIFASIPPIQRLELFCKSVGLKPMVVWKYRKRGWLLTVNIAGRPFITAQAVADFIRRAEAGEFAQQHPRSGKSITKSL